MRSHGGCRFAAAAAVAAMSLLFPDARRLVPAHSSPRPSAFFDVTAGSNDLAGVGCCHATVGYDEASGLGVPNWAVLPRTLPRPGWPVEPCPEAAGRPGPADRSCTDPSRLSAVIMSGLAAGANDPQRVR
jgi:hypothetical protein